MNDHTTHDPSIKLCECGCGQPAPISPVSYAKLGYVKGQPLRYIAGHNARRPAVERFWEKVDVRGPDECWQWTAGKNTDGYGQFTGDDRQHIGAHKFSYELHNGALPEGYKALHKCDNPSCVNPNHLFAGTVADNNHDRLTKNRNGSYDYYRGETHVSAKLSQADVLEIRRLRAQGVNQVELAERFNTSRRNIRSIISRRTWSHI